MNKEVFANDLGITTESNESDVDLTCPSWISAKTKSAATGSVFDINGSMNRRNSELLQQQPVTGYYRSFRNLSRDLDVYKTVRATNETLRLFKLRKGNKKSIVFDLAK